MNTTDIIIPLNTLHLTEHGLFDSTEQAFDAISYSKFKYGDDTVAHAYGVQLAELFISNNQNLFTTDSTHTEIVVAQHPHKYIPKGANTIAVHFHNHLNQYLFSIGKKPILLVPILMEEVFEGDYGTFSESDRNAVMDKQNFFTMKELLFHKHVIIIDDIRITGTGERKISQFLHTQEPSQVYFLYIAKMDEHQATRNPKIESDINHTWMNEPLRLLEIMNSDHFTLNARVAKYVMSLKADSLHTFLLSLHDSPLQQMYFAVIADGYASLPTYKDAFTLLSEELNKRKITTK